MKEETKGRKKRREGGGREGGREGGRDGRESEGGAWRRRKDYPSDKYTGRYQPPTLG